MKKYIVINNFKGSQLGYGGITEFKAGEIALITDYLAEVALKSRDIKPYVEKEIPEASREKKIKQPKEKK